MLYLNGQPLSVTIFPDKTSQVWKIFSPEDHAHECLPRMADVHWAFSSESEFLHLAQLKNLLDHYHIISVLRLSYLPYGRQDKEISDSSTFALRTFASLINFLNFEKVVCMDPHSNIAEKLINKFHAWYPANTVGKAMIACKSDLVCYPDKGALEKYTKVYGYAYMYGEKVRDQLTGNILSYSIVGDPAGKNVLIVDDICDGGATFKLLAKDLLAAGAKSVVLFVTHGIFSKGLQTLKDSGIQRIFTQDGEASEEAGQITYRRL